MLRGKVRDLGEATVNWGRGREGRDSERGGGGAKGHEMKWIPLRRVGGGRQARDGGDVRRAGLPRPRRPPLHPPPLSPPSLSFSALHSTLAETAPQSFW